MIRWIFISRLSAVGTPHDAVENCVNFCAKELAQREKKTVRSRFSMADTAKGFTALQSIFQCL